MTSIILMDSSEDPRMVELRTELRLEEIKDPHGRLRKIVHRNI